MRSAGGVGAWARRRARTGGRVRREMQACARVGAATHQAKFLETAALEKELLRTRSAQVRCVRYVLQQYSTTDGASRGVQASVFLIRLHQGNLQQDAGACYLSERLLSWRWVACVCHVVQER